MLNMHPANLLVKLDAVSIDQKTGYPQHVYFSKEDYKTLRLNLKKYAKKVAPHAPERLLNSSVGTDLLNYGPNTTLSNAIKPGYALVDYEAIDREMMESID